MMSIFYYLSLMGMLLIMANVALSQEEQPFCPRASEENPRCISHRYKKELKKEFSHTTPLRDDIALFFTRDE